MIMNASQTLTSELREIALAALDAYLDAPPTPDGRSPVEIETELDGKRVEVIENTLKPLLAGYLAGSITAMDFKRQVDGVNKQNPLWGFAGIKGQMFFNMLMKTAEDASEFDTLLKSTIREPDSEEEAATLLRNFKSYVTRIGQQFVDAGGDLRSRPKPSSIPFFVSYFWQTHRRDIWPIYYTSTVQIIEGMNLWEATGEIGDDYLTYKRLHETLIEIFSAAASKPFNLCDVEHVFWFKSGRLLDSAPAQPVTKYERKSAAGQTSGVNVSDQSLPMQSAQTSVPPDSYVPPIVAVIPKLGLNDALL